ncbi:MAG: SLBB domain-containing protein [Candidatus Auribacterota bacterium]|nr:SLBB domain-containing protein [Candidatus Auribacterota bacterium]
MNKRTDSLVDKVWKAGVVGAGGAGFPAWKKIDARVETVIVNGAECEPLLRNDQQLMADQAKEIVRGLKLVMDATGAARGIIALKKKYTAAIASLRDEIKGYDELSLHLMESIYPAGDEFVIVYEVTGQVIPPGEIPLKVGILVSNVETFRNISRAEQGDPVISRHLTVTGAVRRPITLELPIGTPISAAIDLAGGPVIDDWVIILGGPMMGEVAESPELPITKTTSAVIVLPSDHPVVTRKTRSLEFDLSKIQSVCCQCDYCTLVCPRALLGHNFKPHIIMRQISLGLPIPDSPGITGADFCCNCDLCGAYSCPMNLPVGRLIQQVAAQIKTSDWEAPPPLAEYSPAARRDYSLIPVSRLTSRLRLTGYDQTAQRPKDKFHPRSVTIPLKQHIGQPAQPMVKKGQRVSSGELIGDIKPGVMGARIHASISGVIQKVSNESVTIMAS